MLNSINNFKLNPSKPSIQKGALSKSESAPFFVSFEGGEGAGKSSLIQFFLKLLNKSSIQHTLLREPGGTLIGEKIREILIDNSNNELSTHSEALLYSASRAQLIHEKIRPSLKSGLSVVCDRFVDASLAYQGIGRKLGLKAIQDLNLWATQGHFPDCTFIVDVDPEIGLKRAAIRQSGKLDRIESESIVFHQNVRNAYLEISKCFPDRIILIDGNQSQEDVSIDFENKWTQWHTNWTQRVGQSSLLDY